MRLDEVEVEVERVGQRLKGWRSALDLTGPEVAARVEAASGKPFDWPALREIEAGEALPEHWVAEALSQVFEQPLEALLGAVTADEAAADHAAATSLELPDHREDELRLRSPYRPRQPRPDAEPWELKAGDRIRRDEVHARFGGGRKAISPCRETPNVLIFSDPTSGPARGLFDRWDDEEKVFLLSGEGPKGDQTFVRGNSAVLNHRTEGRALRLFEGSRGTVTYAGEFALADPPYRMDEAYETGGPLRQVILFRLVPVD